MEMLTPWFLWIPLAFSLLLYYFLQLQKLRGGRLPPGPTPLPIVGSLFLLGDKPHLSLARLARTHGPVMTLQLGQVTTVVISSPDAAGEALQKKDQAFSGRSVPDAIRILRHHEASMIWIPATQQWRNLKKLCQTQLFTSQKLDASQSLRRRKVRDLVSHVRVQCSTGGSVDVGRAAFGTALNLISNTLFSVDLVDLNSESAQEFRDLVWGVMEEVGGPNLSDFFPVLGWVDPQGKRRRVTVYFKRLHKLFDEMIDRRLEDLDSSASSDDFLDELLRNDGSDVLDRHTIKTLLADLFLAGSDTSSNTVEWAMSELLRNPTSMAAARAELMGLITPGAEVEESHLSQLPYLQAVVKETLRLHPPVPLLLPHRTETAVELCGYTVPEHTRVLVNVWAISRDGGVWTEPDLFVPERFLQGKGVEFWGGDMELIPFGAGRRRCPGLPLAVRMVPLMMASLLLAFEWRLPEGMGPRELDMEEKFGVTLAKAVPLRAIAQPIRY